MPRVPKISAVKGTRDLFGAELKAHNRFVCPIWVEDVQQKDLFEYMVKLNTILSVRDIAYEALDLIV